TIVAEMIRSHVGRVKLVLRPTKTDRVSQTAREIMLVRAVRIHLQDAGANLFLLLARITTAADRDVDLFIADEHRARQMPATVFVAEPVIRERGQDLRLAGRSIVAG